MMTKATDSRPYPYQRVENLPRIIEAVTTGGASLEFIKPQEVTLEDVFVAKTGRSLAEDTREVVKEASAGGGGRG